MFQNRFHDNLNTRCYSDNVNSFNTTHSFFNTTFSNAWNRSDILAWLSSLEPRLRHNDIRKRLVENVGEWVLQTEEFKSWYAGSGRSDSDRGVLFCYGDPGVGKTFIR